MSRVLLTCNAGSSSFKATLFDFDRMEVRCRFAADYQEDRPQLRITGADGNQPEALALPQPDSDAAVDTLFSWLDTHHDGKLAAVGHRVVHGGDAFDRPVLIDGRVMDIMRDLTPLAPLHQPHNMAPIEYLLQARPALPQVACFDTAFHRSMPWEAATYALPAELRDKGARRYGFHGLSYEYIASRLPEALPAQRQRRVIVAHLGSGCSACALHDGRSVATTMGLTALDGLMMRTRCGALDPGVPLYLIRAHGYAPGEIERLLYEESGLKALAGGSGDMRDILSGTAEDDRRALALFCYMAAREIGGLMAVLGGAQAIVFTGAIGANSPQVRDGIMRYFAWAGDLPAIALPTDEALMIARHARDLLQHRKEAADGETTRAA